MILRNRVNSTVNEKYRIDKQINFNFNIHDTIYFNIKLVSHLRLSFSHLKDPKFRHNFNDTVDPMCTCGLELEITLLPLAL